MTTDEQMDMITGVTKPQRKKIISWVASLSEETIVAIFQDAVKRSFQLKEHYPNIPGRIKKFGAFILSARHAGWDTVTGKGYRVAETKQYEDFSNLRQAKVPTIIKKGRIPVVRQKILAHWGEIKELKAEGKGFRSIAKYLGNTRKVKTSATYLSRLWCEVEKMVKFEYRGILIEATAQTKRYDYKDANNTSRTRFDRHFCVVTRFWNFEICNDLYELALIKSTLNYFTQAYWKRSSKQGSKIELATSLEHPATNQILYLTARQKNNKQSLEITLHEQWCPSEQIYLTTQEVIMLDVAVSKAISLLGPETSYISATNDRH